jgi:uncharacterized protein YdeI (YjbR/CyaY-like superfamily)
LNKAKAEKLIRQGIMTKAGMAAIDIAKKNGAWTALEKSDNLVIPEDLERALNNNTTAHRNFYAFPKSSRRIILDWIYNSKRGNKIEQNC